MASPLHDNPRSKEVADPLDYTDKYNTELSDDDEKGYQKWIKKQSEAHGRDLRGDNYDYDTRGLYKEMEGKDLEPGHGPDTHKKPNHPTFSDESKYHGKDGNEGGSWGKKGERGTFKPGKTNKQHRSKEELQKYFKDVEPDVDLVDED